MVANKFFRNVGTGIIATALLFSVSQKAMGEDGPPKSPILIINEAKPAFDQLAKETTQKVSDQIKGLFERLVYSADSINDPGSPHVNGFSGAKADELAKLDKLIEDIDRIKRTKDFKNFKKDLWPVQDELKNQATALREVWDEAESRDALRQLAKKNTVISKETIWNSTTRFQKVLSHIDGGTRQMVMGRVIPNVIRAIPLIAVAGIAGATLRAVQANAAEQLPPGSLNHSNKTEVPPHAQAQIENENETQTGN